MTAQHSRYRTPVVSDLTSGMVVFLVALPLCLGIALASGAPLFSGLISGIVGGIVIGALSGSHTSVSGPAAGLTAIVAAQIIALGSFEAFLLALFVAGLIQIVLGAVHAGGLSAFVPSSVIKGLLAAIGVILILKQIPHLFGHDTDPEGEMSFIQPDHESTFSEIVALFGDFHLGASVVGIVSVLILLLWDNVKSLKKSLIPAPIIVVFLGIALQSYLRQFGQAWSINGSHMVQVPVASNLSELIGFLKLPDFTQWLNPAIYSAAIVIAIVASLETLLNLEAVDKLDHRQRVSPPNRELMAQGAGNMLIALLGGIPSTSVIVRSSVNINAGSRTKISAIVHGILLLVCVVFLPQQLNLIPLSCLAAILVVTGVKLVSPKLLQRMWSEGSSQFVPFIVTMLSIVFTDLLIGVTLGLLTSIGFILRSNLRQPLKRVLEKHLGGEVLRIELPNQVSFLNRAALDRVLDGIPRGGHVLLDAHQTIYIDPDVLSMIHEFKEQTAPARGVTLSLRGFQSDYHLEDEIQFVDCSTRELQKQLTIPQILQLFREGNERFRTGHRLARNLERQIQATATGQHPLAVVLSCIDSRTPTELIFDLGLGDIFSVRVAGNVVSPKVLGSMEYACAVIGAKLILVMGHTRCGAVTSAVKLACTHENVEQATGCQNLEPIINDIQQSIDMNSCLKFESSGTQERESVVDAVSRQNVLHSARQILEQSNTIRGLVEKGQVAVVGAMYDVCSGQIEFLELSDPDIPMATTARHGDRTSYVTQD